MDNHDSHDMVLKGQDHNANYQSVQGSVAKSPIHSTGDNCENFTIFFGGMQLSLLCCVDLCVLENNKLVQQHLYSF